MFLACSGPFVFLPRHIPRWSAITRREIESGVKRRAGRAFHGKEERVSRFGRMAESTVRWAALEMWKAGVFRDMERALLMGKRGVAVWGPKYLTFREGTSSKFHMFVVFSYADAAGQKMYVAANGYGRIGTPAKVFEIMRTPSQSGVIAATQDKMHSKLFKGYEEE